MLSLLPALFTLVLAVPPAAADTEAYTVWASAVFARTGERTPEVLGFLPTALTSYGAQQAFDLGSLFRSRYISSAGSSNGWTSAPLQGLSADGIDPMQLYVGTLDQQFSVASAQAFVQGLYPPYQLNASEAKIFDPTSVLANGTYVEAPLSGYQYAQVHTAGALDPEFPYLGGSLDCPGFNVAAGEYTSTAAFSRVMGESEAAYLAVGPGLLDRVLESDAWQYYNAYAIYDYLNYMALHNATVANMLSQPEYTDPNTNLSYLSTMRWYADQQQYAQLGNLTAVNTYSNASASTAPTTGSISTIAGNMLAAKIYAQLQVAIETQGSYYTLSLLVGDFEPLLSFFALAGLPNLNANFQGLPDFGSVAVFELFTYSTSSENSDFPDESDLWVQFFFRNGTDGADASGSDLQSYPLFNRGPSETAMRWSEFQTSMSALQMGVDGWCAECGATNIFCAAWNSSDASTTVPNPIGNTSGSSKAQKHTLSPTVAGVVGAITTLVVAGLIFALVMLFCGVRMHRVDRGKKSELGGFKGGQKLASDRDLTMPKGGAVVGATVEREAMSPIGGHERIGSWELKEEEARIGRLSFESGRGDPFKDPVKADERV